MFKWGENWGGGQLISFILSLSLTRQSLTFQFTQFI